MTAQPIDTTLTPLRPEDGLLEALRRAAGRVRDAADADAVLDGVASAVLDLLGPDQVHVLEVSQDATVSRARVRVRGEDGVTIQPYLQALDGRPSGMQRVIETREALHVPDAAASFLRRDHIERFSIASCLFLPLRVRDEVWAVACCITAERRAFTPAEIAAGQVLVDLAAADLARIDAERRRGAELRHQTAVARAARTVAASLDVTEVLTALCEEADHALAADLAGVYLGDADQGGVGVAGHNVPDGWRGQVIRPGEGVGGQVLRTGRSTVSNDYQHATQVPQIEALREVQTAVSVPMRWDGRLRGALSVAFNRMRRITAEDLAVLEAIADLASVACQNAETYERARAAAQTDSLTGVLNHGAMQGRVAEEVERARRGNRSLSLLLVDLDHFKALNDRHGHQAGDRFLQRVAEAIGRISRPYDALARYGGDEFVLVLPEAPVTEAEEVAERVQAVVRDAAAEAGMGDTGLAASVGLAEWSEPLSAIELLERADRALLLAKRTGRERVRVAGPDVDEELALLDGHEAPAALVREFWDAVAGAAHSDEGLSVLPAFLRRRLDLEEVALYLPGAGAVRGVLRRHARARRFGDPAPPAFTRTALTLAGGGATTGPLTRASLDELLTAMGVRESGASPAGSYAAVPLGRGRTLRGLLLLRAAGRDFPADRLKEAEVLAQHATIALGGHWGDGSPAAVQALAAAIDARDNYTHEHSEQVVALASSVARSLGLPLADVERVERAAMLHDVGKVAIPNEILHKPGRLTQTEWTIMREHPVIGEGILRRTPELADLAPIVRHEHERWDGEGYPDGISGGAIPVGSRVILACDAYNAMITRRPYREPMAPADAREELRANAGKQFDPAVVEALLRVLAAGESEGDLEGAGAATSSS